MFWVSSTQGTIVNVREICTACLSFRQIKIGFAHTEQELTLTYASEELAIQNFQTLIKVCTHQTS
jgi:hypothetical protein